MSLQFDWTLIIVFIILPLLRDFLRKHTENHTETSAHMGNRREKPHATWGVAYRWEMAPQLGGFWQVWGGLGGPRSRSVIVIQSLSVITKPFTDVTRLASVSEALLCLSRQLYCYSFSEQTLDRAREHCKMKVMASPLLFCALWSGTEIVTKKTLRATVLPTIFNS